MKIKKIFMYLLIVVACMLCAFTYTQFQVQDTYTASVEIEIQHATGRQPYDYVKFARSNTIYDDITLKYGDEFTLEVNITPDFHYPILYLNVTSNDSNKSVEIVTEIAKLYLMYGDEQFKDSYLAISTYPSVSTLDERPYIRNIILGAMIGIGIVCFSWLIILIKKRKPVLYISQNKILNYNNLFIIITTCLLLREALLLFGVPILHLSLYWIMFLALLVMLTIGVLSKLNNIDNGNLLILVYILLFIVLFAAVYNTNFANIVSILNLKQTLGIIIVILLLYVQNIVKLSKKVIAIYFKGSIILSIFVIVFAFFPTSYNWGLLLLHFDNPNTAGLLIMLLFFNSFVFYQVSKKKIILPILFALLFVCYLTHSRTALLCCILCVCLTYFLKYYKKLINIVFDFVVMMPALIPFVLMFLKVILPSNFQFMGKALFSGRNDIWDTIFSRVLNNPFVSNFGQIIDPITQTTHNALWGVMWDYSIFAFILIIILILITCRRARDINNIQGLSMYCAFMACIIYMSFEVVFISFNINYLIFAYVFSLMINTYRDDKPDEICAIDK